MHFLKASAFVVGLWNQKEGFPSVMIAFVFLSDLVCLLDAVYHTNAFRHTPGGDSHMKQTGMLVVSLRGVNFGFWSRLGCSGQSANILCHQVLV